MDDALTVEYVTIFLIWGHLTGGQRRVLIVKLFENVWANFRDLVPVILVYGVPFVDRLIRVIGAPQELPSVADVDMNGDKFGLS